MATITNRDQALIEEFIEEDRLKPGRADARVKGGKVHVWAIIGYLQGVKGDASQVAKAYQLSAQAVEAAEAYYQLNRELIDARLALNSD